MRCQSRKQTTLEEITMNAYRRIRALLKEADVRIGGDRPYNIAVHDDRFFAHVLAYGSLGAGEAYMNCGRSTCCPPRAPSAPGRTSFGKYSSRPAGSKDPTKCRDNSVR